MMIKHSSTISLLLMYAHITGTVSTTTSNSTEDSNPAMFSFLTTSPQPTSSPNPATTPQLGSSPQPTSNPNPAPTAQLGSSVTPVTKHSELISKSTWQGSTSSSINTTVAGGSTPLKSRFNTHSLFLCIFTLVCILSQK